MKLLNWFQRLLHPDSVATEKRPVAGAYKWLPVIAQDYCTGCGHCVKACDRNCLELVWDFATLQRAGDCNSDANCVAACPETTVIAMGWVSMEGDPSIGRWRTVKATEDSPKTN
jgi:Na+-translocating ferredoxin:NAD+ oxidoreductase RNF subunit RnfB